jgi:hypothetical protein
MTPEGLAVKWQTPPESKTSGRPSKNQHVAEALRARPGQWALIHEAAASRSFTTIIMKGRVTAFEPAGEFEAVSRRRQDGRFDIYARFVGPASDA